MKAKKILLALLLLLSASQARCDDFNRPVAYLFDIVLFKPVGLALTVAGAGLYAGLSPLIALADISPPHNAFLVAADLLVIAPADFTFVRPVGAFYPYDDIGY